MKNDYLKFSLTPELCFKMMIISVFLFNYAVREKFVGILKDVNILFYLAIFILIAIKKFKFSKWNMITTLFLLGYSTYINISTSSRINNTIFFIVCTILPLFVLTIDVSNLIKNKKQFISNIINYYNSCINILFIIYIFDLLSGCKVSSSLASILTSYPQNWMPSSVIGMRYHFYFAHPLTSSAHVMIYYLLNMIAYSKKIEIKTNYWVVTIISAFRCV